MTTFFNFNVNSYQIHELKALYNEACENTGINLFASYDSNDIVKCKQNLYKILIGKNPHQHDEIKMFLEMSSQLLLKDMESKQASQLTSLYVRPVEQDTLNPNLKNLTRRIINIDSQYREDILPYTHDNPNSNSSATNFLANFSDSLMNVVSLSLYSIQIPRTWYVIDKCYGNDFFYIEAPEPIGSKRITVPSGNYSENELMTIINVKIADAISAPLTPLNVTFSWNENNGLVSIINETDPPLTLNIVFYDASDSNFTSQECNVESPKLNYNLGWFLGFRNIENNVLQYEIPVYNPNNEEGTTITSEAVCDINGPKYFLLLVDDFNQNHLSKGLVNIDTNKPFIKPPSYFNPSGSVSKKSGGQPVCDLCPPSGPGQSKTDLTKSQVYTYNQIKEYRNTFASNNNSRINAVTTTNIMAIVPLDIVGIPFGKVFTDNGSALEANIRSYFGPVNIEKMKICLMDDRGKVVNLHGADWCFGLISEHLYKY